MAMYFNQQGQIGEQNEKWPAPSKPTPQDVANALAVLQASDITDMHIGIHRRPTVEGLPFEGKLLQSEPDPALAEIKAELKDLAEKIGKEKGVASSSQSEILYFPAANKVQRINNFGYPSNEKELDDVLTIIKRFYMQSREIFKENRLVGIVFQEEFFDMYFLCLDPSFS